MMRSMFSGVSGLKVHQTKMDVIGNNIANVNTVGYKSQRVTFSDVFSQTISSASSASDDTGRGGVNAMQVGLGVNVSSIDMLMTQGAAQRTDNPFDLMIDGDGFIVVGDSSGKYFTRAGALRQDDEGNLVISNGMKVQGWLATQNEGGEYAINVGEVQDINLSSGENKSAKPSSTTKSTLSGNLCTTDESATTSINFYDSLGNYYTLPVVLSNDGEGIWTLAPQENTDNKIIVTDQKGNKYEADVDIDGNENVELEFDSKGKLIGPADADGTIQMPKVNVVITAGVESNGVTPSMPASNLTTADGLSLDMDLSTVTQYSLKSSVDSTSNGYTAGTLSGYSIGSDGIITATYTNGEMRAIAQVPLANFDNPAGLEKVGDNLYAMTLNSGEFDGIGSAGVFNTGVLEMSNVDLSSEFTDMIITQRGFQANSRIITVSDEMLQELTNLKR